MAIVFFAYISTPGRVPTDRLESPRLPRLIPGWSEAGINELADDRGHRYAARRGNAPELSRLFLGQLDLRPNHVITG
jgi:hypothetical protein